MFQIKPLVSVLREISLVLHNSTNKLKPYVCSKGFELAAKLVIEDRVEKAAKSSYPGMPLYAPGFSYLKSPHKSKESDLSVEETKVYKTLGIQSGGQTFEIKNFDAANNLIELAEKEIADEKHRASFGEYRMQQCFIRQNIAYLLDMARNNNMEALKYSGLTKDEFNSLSDIFSVLSNVALKDYVESGRYNYCVYNAKGQQFILPMLPDEIQLSTKLAKHFQRLAYER